MSFIALNKPKHEACNMFCSHVELKLTDFTLLDAHTLPIHGTAWRVCMWGFPKMCVFHIIIRDKNRTTVKVLFPLHTSAMKGFHFLGLVSKLYFYLFFQFHPNHTYYVDCTAEGGSPEVNFIYSVFNAKRGNSRQLGYSSAKASAKLNSLEPRFESRITVKVDIADVKL